MLQPSVSDPALPSLCHTTTKFPAPSPVTAGPRWPPVVYVFTSNWPTCPCAAPPSPRPAASRAMTAHWRAAVTEGTTASVSPPNPALPMSLLSGSVLGSHAAWPGTVLMSREPRAASTRRLSELDDGMRHLLTAARSAGLYASDRKSVV